MSRGEPLIRQWNLLKAMQAVHFGLSADELAIRLECSKRQVGMLSNSGLDTCPFGKSIFFDWAHFNLKRNALGYDSARSAGWDLSLLPQSMIKDGIRRWLSPPHAPRA